MLEDAPALGYKLWMESYRYKVDMRMYTVLKIMDDYQNLDRTEITGI
jgi:hypothetical protein